MKYFLAIASIGLLLSCQSGKDKLTSKIKQEESQLLSGDKSLNDSVATTLLNDYREYSSSYPEDKQSPDYLFKAAELCNGSARFTQAIALFEQLSAKFPEYSKNAEATLICGFIAENNLMDTTLAGNYYRKLISTYPLSPLKEQAELALGHMGKSPEELVKEFEAKNKK